MKDFEGKELSIGDEVVFIYSNLTGGKKLMRGKIEKFEKGNVFIQGMTYGVYDESPESVDPHWGVPVKVKSTSIYKI